jgi:HPt (histidine-containing phosphotransfer) domain-containing protein
MGLVNWEMALRNAGGNEEILRGLLEDCAGEAPRLIRQLSDAVERGDGATARRAVHTLRSFSRLFGAQTLGSTAGRMEMLIGSGEMPAGRELLPGLERDVAAVVTEVESRLHGGDGSRVR